MLKESAISPRPAYSRRSRTHYWRWIEPARLGCDLLEAVAVNSAGGVNTYSVLSLTWRLGLSCGGSISTRSRAS